MFNSFSSSVNIETLYFVQLSRVSMILTEWSGWILHWSDIGERWFLILIRYILNSTRQSNRKFLLKDCRFFYTFTNLFKNLFFNITRFYFNCWGPYKIVCQQKSNKKNKIVKMQYSKDHNSKKKKKESKQITWENTFKEPTSMILVAKPPTGGTRCCTPITISNKPPGSIKQPNEARSTSDPPFSNLSSGMWEGGRVISCRISRNVK